MADGAEQKRPPHVHRWRIEEPAGATSRGACRECGLVREFKNALEKDFLSNDERRGAA